MHTMPPLPSGEGSTLGVRGDEVVATEALPGSPTRKTRFVRIHRDKNGVETSRTYTDGPGEGSERTPLSPLKVVKSRNGAGTEPSKTTQDDSSTTDYGYSNHDQNQPASPTKKTIVRVQRNSQGVELSRTRVDVADEPSESNTLTKDVLASPTKTRLVRVRRNSLGMETSRTYMDTDENSSHHGSPGKGNKARYPRRSSTGSEGSSYHSGNETPLTPASLVIGSPTKTRLVRVRRNSLGMETSRVYVDTIGDGATGGGKHDASPDPTPCTPMSSPVRQAPKSSVSPSKILSPSKMMAQRGKLGAKRESMRKVMDGGKSKATPESRKAEGVKEAMMEKNPLSLKVPVLDDTKPTTPSRKAKAEVENAHFVTTPPNRSKSMMNIQPTVYSTKDDNQMQAIRLLRVLLGEDTASISKESVDRALEKHADLLRFQLQQKKKLKQKDEVIEQEKKQSEQVLENHAKEIAKLEKEVNKQKMLMQTSLDIKNVEIDILKKERDQKAVKIQQLTWRLAKERMAAKNKEAQGAETPLAPVEPAICARCQALEKEESESSHDLLQITTSRKLMVQDDELSVETPIMGQSASTGMVLSLLDASNHKKNADGGKDSPLISELERKLDDTEHRLDAAKKAIELLKNKKQEMEADFEETQHENKAKKAQLKAVLVACNERRKAAEQMLRDLGKFDEGKLAAISKKPPDELISEIVKDSSESQSSSARTTEHETLASQNKTLQEAKVKLESELASLRKKIKEYEAALASAKEQHEETCSMLERKLDAEVEMYAKLEKDLNEQVDEYAQEIETSRATIAKLETELKRVNEEHKLAAEEVTQNNKELNEAKTLLTQSEGMISEYSARLLDANKSIQAFEEKVVELTAKLEGSRRTTEQSEKRANAYLMEITDAKMGLQKTSFRLNESSTKLKETEMALKKAELQIQEYATELQNVTEALQESESMAEKYLMMLEEANSTLLQSEKLMKKYDKGSDILDTPSCEEATSEYGEESDNGSAVSEDFSSKTTEDLLALAARRLDSLLPAEENSDGTKSQKISQQILKSPYQNYMKPRISKDRVLELNNSARTVDRYDASSVTSTHGADTEASGTEAQLLQQWESSRQHNEDASKIAKLETELAERQLQLNDALRKIDEQSRRMEQSSVSSKGESNNEALVAALTKMAELQERVAIAEAKYKEATKKLLFLKQTVLTVVDTDAVV